ncbi:MAG TPA: ribosome maturation factor RimP [Candidatus Dormibacteraeota bacterium]|nr:ribosome maturation factor RimP [Candidatus Dormibacteraeota bacterium]
MVAAAVESSGCELWEMRLVGSPPHQVLKVFIESPGGVDIATCMRVSRALRPALDEAGEGMQNVDLEVSSPGAERRLRDLDDYRRFLGQRVNLRFRQGDGEAATESVVEGLLSAVEEGAVTVIGAGDQQTRVPLDQLVQGRLAVAFGGGDKIKRRQT